MCLQKTYNQLRKGKYLSDAFPIREPINSGQIGIECTSLASTLMMLIYCTQSAINKTQECLSQVIKKVTQLSAVIVMTRHQNAGYNHNKGVDNKSSENVAHSKYFGITATDQNYNHIHIKSRLIPNIQARISYLPVSCLST
jgi:hypothetical protein